MNRKAIESLASFIEQREDIRFDYADGGRCIYGFACIQHRIPAGGIGTSEVNNVLGINQNQANRLFSMPMTREGRHIDHPMVSRSNAVETLKRFAETGVIFFNEPTPGDRTMGAECSCADCVRIMRRGITRDDFRREREAMRAEAINLDQQLRSDRRELYLDSITGEQFVIRAGDVFTWSSEPSPKVEEPQTA